MNKAFDQAILAGVRAGADQAAPKLVDVCLDALWSHPWFPLIAGGQARLMEAGVKPREAWALSRKVLLQWVKDEKITFGDPGYGWDATAGRLIIEECELEYWETRP